MSYSVIVKEAEAFGCLYCEMYAVIDGEEYLLGSDGGEPEDNYFCRDWDWIEAALLQAYQKGLEDGRTVTTPKEKNGETNT